MITVPFLDLQASYLELSCEIDTAIKRVLASGSYILGREVDLFEEEFSAYVEARYAVGVGNGLDALTLALRALDIGPGDEVIVPSNTYIATWLAVSHCGATPIPVEPDASTYNIDTTLIEAAITPKTKAIIPVHLYGHPADLDAINAIASNHDLRIIEDAAQCHGASYKGRRIGSHSDIVAWSFYPGKNLGAFGDGGAISTNNRALAEKVRILRNYGSPAKYVNSVIGFNSRLDDIQAAILRVKLKHLDEWNKRRTEIAKLYSQRLFGEALTLPIVSASVVHAWHLYVVRHPKRQQLLKLLEGKGINTLIHYPTPPGSQEAYKHLHPTCIPRKTTNLLASEIFSLPMGPHLSLAQAEYAIECLIESLHCVEHD